MTDTTGTTSPHPAAPAAERPPETPPPAPSPDEAPATLGAAILDGVRGVHRDYTRGALGPAILALAVPMVLEMLMESIFAVVDVFFVARLGPAAVATVGLTESLLTIVYTGAVGLGIGATAMVARRIGEGDRDGAARTAVQALALGAIGGLATGVAGALAAPQLLALMGAEPDVLREGVAYTRIILGGNVVIMLLFLANAIFRGAGDAAVAMRVLWLANGINIVLCPLLIFGPGPFPELGIAGAATATTIGRGIGAAFAISRLFRDGGHLRVERRHLRLELDTIARLLRLSATGTLQVFIGMASWIGLVRILSAFGSTAVAGYTIGIRIVLFALFPSFGLANAAATMVGQALGAKDPARAEQAVWRTAFYNVCFLGTVGTAFLVFARPLVAIFEPDDAAVAAYAVDCLRIVALGFVFYAYGMVLEQSFNGAGDTWTPTVLNFAIFWLFEIPLAWALASARAVGLGPRGVFIAITVAFSALAVVSAVIFRRGRWKTKAV